MNLENGHSQNKPASETMTHSWFAPTKLGAPLQNCPLEQVHQPTEKLVTQSHAQVDSDLKTGAVIVAAL